MEGRRRKEGRGREEEDGGRGGRRRQEEDPRGCQEGEAREGSDVQADRGPGRRRPSPQRSTPRHGTSTRHRGDHQIVQHVPSILVPPHTQRRPRLHRAVSIRRRTRRSESWILALGRTLLRHGLQGRHRECVLSSGIQVRLSESRRGLNGRVRQIPPSRLVRSSGYDPRRIGQSHAGRRHQDRDVRATDSCTLGRYASDRRIYGHTLHPHRMAVLHRPRRHDPRRSRPGQNHGKVIRDEPRHGEAHRFPRQDDQRGPPGHSMRQDVHVGIEFR
mmetsp:Transcript_38083/g.113755  ORF Transcript_38083/g.113755 Transcript_38083/m.113755 type:complete len:273 (-) Transcript_38083:797-1615(-)